MEMDLGLSIFGVWRGKWPGLIAYTVMLWLGGDRLDGMGGGGS